MEPYSTMTEAVDGLKSRGFGANFELIDNKMQAMESGHRFEAAELTIVEHYRFEGITNPADESIVFAIESHDGTKGVLVDAYGVYANPELTAFLKGAEHRQGR
ncbi:MAG: hypothetical protein AMJ68_01990 [Acidithiobacillales bacterium SG8_45]|nr:MAG: hypothetical protein AMJ68_01990 [Acidithiobacillales bacterium SG8_45]